MSMRLPHNHGKLSLDSHIAAVLEKENFQAAANIFKLLDDPVRLQVFWILCHSEVCVANLAYMLGITSPALSHHLKILKEGNILTSRREKKEVFYKASDSTTAKALHQALEQILSISCPEQATSDCPICPETPANLQETMQAVHQYLLSNLDKRIPITALSKQFLMNPTTLKESFKKVYGVSISAHIKSHRMEAAANLLRTTEQSIGEISRAVGYTSQSKFSAAFAETYDCTPLQYRKRHKK